MRHFVYLTVMLLFATNLGCASINVRMGGYSTRAPIYPAAAVDVGVVTYVIARPFISMTDPQFHPDAQEPLVYLFLPFSIIDLPLAVAVDTLFLPYDLHKWHNQETESEFELDSSLPVKVPSAKLE